jgi:hypothetical protein
MRVAIVKDQYSEVLASRQPTWEQLCKTLSSVAVGEKHGAAWIPADIEKGSRKSERVSGISYLAIDVEVRKERQPPSVNEMITRLSALQLRSMLHTTYNHDPAAPRYRVICCINKVIAPKALKDAIEALALKLEISECYDTSCTDPARLFFLPRCGRGREGLFQAEVIDGHPVDVDSLLGEKSKTDSNKIHGPLDSKLLNFPTPETPENVSRAKVALEHINADCDYQTWRNVIWALISTGWDSAEQLAREWSLTAPDRFEEMAFQRVVRSFDFGKGITLGTLFHHAKAAGRSCFTWKSK